MQNEELRIGRSQLEHSRAKYADLFDFAPVGYFTLDQHGRVLQVNVRGARLLGVARAKLLHQRFMSFLASASVPVFLRHLREVFQGRARRFCELSMQNVDGRPFSVQLESVLAEEDPDEDRCCRTTVIDLTLRKKAEDALRKGQETLATMVEERTRELSESNRALQAQILQRERAERELQRAHTELERRVQERTAELLQTKQVLEAEIVQRKRAEAAHLLVLQRLVEAQEAESCRVARELHDQFGQEVAALSLGLNGIGEQLPLNSPLRPRVAQMLDIVGSVLRDVHSLVWKLRPPALDDLGLATALERYTAEWAKLSGIPVHFHNCGLDHRRMSSQIETTLYRIAQEALTNVFKHAQARNVSVLLEGQRNQIGLIIEDDGRGFAVESMLNRSPDAQGHVGLLGMRERATLAGGTVNIESSRGSGTTVFVRIPVATEPVRDLEIYEKNSRSIGRRSQHHA